MRSSLILCSITSLIGRALAEIRRVLKPGGWLFATTAGDKHMQESWEVEREMQQNGGAIDITKDSGMFIAEQEERK